MSASPKPQRLALASLILAVWLLALAIWIFAGGGFVLIAETPHLTLPIMIMGGIGIQVVCMSIAGLPRRKQART